MKHLVAFLLCILCCNSAFTSTLSNSMDGVHAKRLQEQSSASKPNILLIVLDDAGYGDIAGFGASVAPTPTLKQLGDEGVRFTRFYADSTCRPARVSLMTGQQASRVAMASDFHGISPEVETLPEKLRQAGYTTHHIGKWHLGDTARLAWPSAQGFDDWFGFLSQFWLKGPNEKGEMIPHRPTYINPWLQDNDSKPQQYQGHLENILADRVVAKIQSLKQSGTPWFINYWTFAPHNPAVPSDVYRKQFPKGKAGQYQALLKQMDDEINRVLKTLDETGQADNTLIVVLSDNGGTNELEANNGPYEGEKALYSEGGTRTPMIIRWPKNMPAVPAHQQYDGIAAIYDVYPTLLAAAGANVSGIDGINLLPLVLQQQPRPPQPLFWEIGSDYDYNYSVLSDDGNWRLDDKRLYHLQTDPFAKTNVADKQSAKVRELEQLFLDWRKQVHYLNLDTQVLAGDKYKVMGDSFRRSPGYGGFTFVTSITPGKNSAPVGVIAEQKGMWLMEMTADQRIHIRMHDHETISGPVAMSACTPLVLSTYYYRSKLQPKYDHAVWVLTLGNQEVLTEKWLNPSVFPENFPEPTYIGQAGDGSNGFTGLLESPQFYNEFFYSKDPWNMGRDSGSLTQTMCRAH